MPNEKNPPRGLQQQPARESDPQQQQAGASDFQGRSARQQHAGAANPNQVEGEGSYSATRDYQRDLKDYLKDADVARDGAAAKPRSEAEAREMEEAEREGRSHSKGER